MTSCGFSDIFFVFFYIFKIIVYENNLRCNGCCFFIILLFFIMLLPKYTKRQPKDIQKMSLKKCSQNFKMKTSNRSLYLERGRLMLSWKNFLNIDYQQKSHSKEWLIFLHTSFINFSQALSLIFCYKGTNNFL